MFDFFRSMKIARNIEELIEFYPEVGPCRTPRPRQQSNKATWNQFGQGCYETLRPSKDSLTTPCCYDAVERYFIQSAIWCHEYLNF